MPADRITKFVCDFFNEKYVVVAKGCLLSHLPPTNTSQHNVRRKGDKQEEQGNTGHSSHHAQFRGGG